MTTLVKLYESQIIANIRLTKYQQMVLATMLSAHDNTGNIRELSQSPNEIQAYRTLHKLRLIDQVDSNTYTVTDTGIAVAKDENLIDRDGKITQYGSAAIENRVSTPSAPQNPSHAQDSNTEHASTSSEVGMSGHSESVVVRHTMLQQLLHV